MPVKFNPKAIAKRIRKVQQDIDKGLRRNEDGAVNDILDLLQQFKKEIRSAMNGIEGDTFNAAQLRRMNDLIDSSIEDFKTRAGLVVKNRSTIAAKSSEEYWSKTTSLWNASETSLVAPVLSDQMLSVISGISTELIKGLSEDVANKTKGVLQRAVLGNQSPWEAMKKISQVVGERGNNGAAYSAERIVRTEMGRAYNGADRLIGNKVADNRPQDLPALKKVWISTNDDRTRHSHVAANKQVVDYDEKFTVGGEKIDWPVVDPNASAGNVINCRCFAIVVPENLLDDTLKAFP